MSHIIDVHILVYYTEQSGMVVCHPGRNLNSGTALLRGGGGVHQLGRSFLTDLTLKPMQSWLLELNTQIKRDTAN
jgi:hypothetical protein